MEISWIGLLRAVHLSAGAVWFGVVLFSTTFLGPVIRDSGESARGFMAAVERRGGFGKFMGPVGILAILSGLLLYWRMGYLDAPFRTTSSTLLTLGGLLALGAWSYGTVVMLPLQRRVATLAKKGDVPIADLQAMQARFQSRSAIMGYMILAAFALMVLRGVVS